MIQNFKDIVVYQKAYECSLKVHKISLGFPDFERYELGGQIRRAAKSVAFNIAEGFAKKSGSLGEFKRFLYISLGSCEEVRVALGYSKDLEYITETEYSAVEGEYHEIAKLLTSMIKTWT